MPGPSEKLAASLERLKSLQDKDGAAAIRSRNLSRLDRERLLKNGFLKEVMKGWYVPARPDEQQGESTAWYASFWRFSASYLEERFDKEWCLSPEQSLSLHAGNWSVPEQLVVRSPKSRNNVTALPYKTSLLEVRSKLPETEETEIIDGLRLFSLEAALISCSPGFYTQNPTDARAALAMVKDSSGLLAKLLDGGHSSIAGRLTGAFRNIGRKRIADDIIKTMQTADYKVIENDPFETALPYILAVRETSPYVNRIKLLWQTMRTSVIDHFPEAPGLPRAVKKYMKHVEDVYVTDAYHSLSIEGYRVTPELIERVREGSWNPDNNEQDREYKDALAARGYWQAFQAVHNSVERILGKENPGHVADEDHSAWYRELFAPSVTAGILRPSDLAGYRYGPIYLRRSMHVPMNHEAVRDVMPVFFELLTEEENAAARVVLGHFIFVYIHPYFDGNGRIGRFLMNSMIAAGGYPWTVIPVEKRIPYMEALEKASVGQDIVPFTKFLARLVEKSMAGDPLPDVPK